MIAMRRGEGVPLVLAVASLAGVLGAMSVLHLLTPGWRIYLALLILSLAWGGAFLGLAMRRFEGRVSQVVGKVAGINIVLLIIATVVGVVRILKAHIGLSSMTWTGIVAIVLLAIGVAAFIREARRARAAARRLRDRS